MVSLLAPLEQLLLSKIDEIATKLVGVNTESKFLESNLRHLVARMDDELTAWSPADGPAKATARLLVAEMHALRQRIEDCLDRFDYKVTYKEKTSTLKGAVPALKKTWTRKGFADEIKHLNKCLQQLKEWMPGNRTDAPEGADGQLSTCTRPQGIAQAREKLLELLRGGEPETKLRVIAIVGFGGSGKTTLANEVYQRRVADGCLGAWIDRANYKDATTLLEEIIKGFKWDGPPGPGSRTPTQLQLYIKDKMTEQRGDVAGEGTHESNLKHRYVLALDDMDNTGHWEAIEDTFDATADTSIRIIVTTRFRPIANLCRTHGDGYVHEMTAIGDVASRQVSGGLGDDEYSKKLLEKCGGHPLALCSVARHLRGSDQGPTQDNCKALCGNLGKFLHDGMDDDNVDQFKRLRGVLMDILVGLRGDTVRSSLLYLGIFPNGRPIKRSRVTRRWLAEGYAAEESIKKFIDRNVIQPIGTRQSSKEWKECSTPSILHEFVLHKSISKNFIMAIDDGPQEQRTDSSRSRNKKDGKVRHISINSSNNITTRGDTDLSSVHSLTVSEGAGLGGAFSDFSEYELLRVLDVEDRCDISERSLEDICKLWHLRYLSLGTNIAQVPEEIAKKLYNLETLQLSKEEVSELPVQVIGMPGLIHLIGKFEIFYESRKEQEAIRLSKKSKLQTLAGVVANGETGSPLLLIPNMKKLKKVKIWCCSNGDITNLDTQLLQCIQRYTESVNNKRSLSIDFKGLNQSDMEKLEKVFKKKWEKPNTINYYLRSLKLQAISAAVPEFLAAISDLTTLCLSLNTVAQDLLSRLSSLIPLLVHLKLIASEVAAHEALEAKFSKLQSLCFQISGASAAHLKIRVKYVDGYNENTSALPNLVSLQLLCESLPDPSGIPIIDLEKLREIELHHTFKEEEARRSWEVAAWNHPKRPKVLPLVSVDDPEDADAGDATGDTVNPAARGAGDELAVVRNGAQQPRRNQEAAPRLVAYGGFVWRSFTALADKTRSVMSRRHVEQAK